MCISCMKGGVFFQSFCKYFSRDISCPIPCSPARMPSQRAHFSLSEVPGHREWGPSAVHREVALASSSTGGRGPGQQHRRLAGAVCFTSLIAPVFPFSWGSKGGIWRPGTKGRPRLSSFSSVDTTRRLSPCFTSSTYCLWKGEGLQVLLCPPPPSLPSSLHCSAE